QPESLFYFAPPRPVAVVFVEGTRLFTSDEPVIVNTGGDHVRHHPDCSLTQADIDKRLARERHKKAKRRKDVSRVVHFAPTQLRGVQDAIELVLPISPTAGFPQLGQSTRTPTLSLHPPNRRGISRDRYTFRPT